ncbi:MAG: FkbM family methyltransferase [Myxococcales bacterium]|nr:FkbM family methyltransferase [Myxococcales bacterium]
MASAVTLRANRSAKTRPTGGDSRPLPRLFEKLPSIEENGIKNITVHAVGLGAERAKLPFFAPPDENLGTGSFVDGYHAENRPLHELEIVVGDEALETASAGPIAMLKVDIEGYEKAALQGLTKTLTRDRPIIVMEITIDQKTEHTFKSREKLAGVLPESYELLRFARDKGLDVESGRYQLAPLQIDFGHDQQLDIVALPSSLVAKLPREGGPPKEP